MTADDFKDFEAAYGKDPFGRSKREDTGAQGRFRRFTRDEVGARSDNLDIAWLRGDDVARENQLTEPADISAAIVRHLQAALVELDETSAELEMDASGGAAE